MPDTFKVGPTFAWHKTNHNLAQPDEPGETDAEDSLNLAMTNWDQRIKNWTTIYLDHSTRMVLR
jgi:hypothetical protein